ncbi:MAG TPA: methyltransferase domain-containing protein [Planctomycetaceae bacterium]|nr:methyltransferase domain-containing protein [Planctomycetaceae bacterium]
MSAAPAPSAARTVESEPPRFAFGRNWSRFLRTVTEERIAAATQSLHTILGPAGLQGRRFLDIGSGSGLFSLAAYRLGADVTSFDYDADSVACTEELRHREQAAEHRWQVEQGSVLDAEYLATLGTFDVVYSWGVLHHTGQMWTALELASQCVAEDGTFWIALYNDQGVWSRVWAGVKQLYVRLPRWLRPAYVVAIGVPWAATRAISKFTAQGLAALFSGLNTGRISPPSPPRRTGLMASQRVRGMHWWYDLVDWIGGFPFEVARPEDVVTFLRERGFELEHLTTCGGNLGCNEFIFRRKRLA